MDPEKRDAIIMAELIRAASAGDPCPINDDLAAKVGMIYTKSIILTMERLEAEKLISIERNNSRRRRITIVATGACTGWTVRSERRMPDAKPTNDRMDAAAIEARAAADQAMLRERREKHLRDEQERYSLARRGVLPEDMPTGVAIPRVYQR